MTIALWLAAIAAYPTVAEAGFHHCALIYDVAERSADDLSPYAVELRDGRPQGWLFDSFLFLIQSTPGGSTMGGLLGREDWQYHLDRWFAPARDLAALDEAIESAAPVLGVPPKRQIILSIPYPHPRTTDFGDVDGDGAAEDLSSPTGLAAVYRWYTGEAIRRFRAAGYRHLELWGFYWMNEGISSADEPRARLACDLVHEAGYRMFWIPWFRAPGVERWREIGFDVALMQPNYAFFCEHGGRLRPNRLAIAAEVAREHGLGVEIELPMAYNDPAAAAYFLRYLAEGAADRWAYQQVPTAYYVGGTGVADLCRSQRPWQRELYAALAAYVRGETVPPPDPVVTWQADARAEPQLSDRELTGGVPLTVAEAELPAGVHVSAVDVFFDEPSREQAWRGLVTVEVRGAEGDWRPGGWALRGGHDESTGRYQVATAPVRSDGLRAVRVHLDSAAGSPPPTVAEIAIDASAAEERRITHRAVGAPYTFDPPPQATYGDRGGELTDEVIPTTGFGSGDTVGWHGVEVTVTLDLAEEVAIDRAEVYLEGGGYAAVHWPFLAVLATSADRPPKNLTGDIGAPPAGLAPVSGGAVVIDRRRAEDAADGHIPFELPTPRRARYLTFVFGCRGWLMLHEIKVYAGDVNVAAGRRYSLRPAPSTAGTEKYGDDGERLTDGVVAQGFRPRELTGWNTAGPRAVTLDLGAVGPLNRVTVWSLAGGLAAIYAPGEVTASCSEDGVTWQSLGTLTGALGAVEDGQRAEPLAYRFEPPGPISARYVRVEVTLGRGWAMLSEVAVE